MAKDKQTEKDDIVTQHYRGPGPVAAGLGEGALQTKFMALTGLVLGGAAAAFFPKTFEPMFKKFNSGLGKAKSSENQLIKAAGGIGHWFMEIPKGIVKWLRGFESVNSRIEKIGSKKVEAVFDGAIITSTGLSIFGSLLGGGLGYQRARAGRKQFHDAKTEISSLRGKLIETQSELEDLKTADAAKKGELKVAGDEPPPMEAAPKEIAPPTTPEHTSPAANWAEKITSEKAEKNDPAPSAQATKSENWSEDILAQKAQKSELALS